MAEIDNILAEFTSRITGACFWKAYQKYAEKQSVKQINITLEIVSDTAGLEEEKAELLACVWVPTAVGIGAAEHLFIQMCRVMEESGRQVLRIKKGSILQDEDLGLMMVPCTLVFEPVDGNQSVSLTIDGAQVQARSIQVAAVQTEKALFAFGESVPFERCQQKTSYSVTLKGFDGTEFEGCRNFTVMPEDGGFAYFNCRWSRYSLTKKEFTFISEDRRAQR